MRRPRGETRERIYRFVRERLLAGLPPTVREVQEAVGLRAVESARTHLERLVTDGRLAKDPGIARGYRLPSGGGVVPALVPLVGRVQAGGLTAAIEDPDGHVAVTGAPSGTSSATSSGTSPGALFALRVAGDSMRDAGILEGDVVIVRRDARPRDGHVVVAMVGDEATVKTLRRTKDERGRRRVELHPANPDFEPIILDPKEAAILNTILLGRVVEVRREL
jgi:repressor LexA